MNHYETLFCLNPFAHTQLSDLDHTGHGVALLFLLKARQWVLADEDGVGVAGGQADFQLWRA